MYSILGCHMYKNEKSENYVIDAFKENGYYLLYNSEMPTIPRLSHYSPFYSDLIYYRWVITLQSSIILWRKIETGYIYIYIVIKMIIIPIISLVAYHCQRGAMEGITPLTRSLPVTFNDETYTSLLVPPCEEDDVNDLPEYKWTNSVDEETESVSGIILSMYSSCLTTSSIDGRFSGSSLQQLRAKLTILSIHTAGYQPILLSIIDSTMPDSYAVFTWVLYYTSFSIHNINENCKVKSTMESPILGFRLHFVPSTKK